MPNGRQLTKSVRSHTVRDLGDFWAIQRSAPRTSAWLLERTGFELPSPVVHFAAPEDGLNCSGDACRRFLVNGVCITSASLSVGSTFNPSFCVAVLWLDVLRTRAHAVVTPLI